MKKLTVAVVVSAEPEASSVTVPLVPIAMQAPTVSATIVATSRDNLRKELIA
jgi:hypothetical protein